MLQFVAVERWIRHLRPGTLSLLKPSHNCYLSDTVSKIFQFVGFHDALHFFLFCAIMFGSIHSLGSRLLISCVYMFWFHRAP
jgi:hypothetical protein